MHIRNILKKGYSLFCYLQLYFRWYNKVVTERLKYNRKVLDMNIAAYCRVSTDKADQLNSLEAQKQFFSEYTQRTGDNLVRLYADEGISGTKIKNRKEFNKTPIITRQQSYITLFCLLKIKGMKKITYFILKIHCLNV